MVRTLCILLLAASLGACAGTTTPAGPAPPSPSDGAVAASTGPLRYSGVALLTGRRLFAVLDTRLAGDAVVAGLEIPALSLAASGAGRWRGPRLHVDLAYAAPCPGTVTIRVERADDDSLSGTLSARDCTGEAQGTLEMALAPSEGW